MVAGHGGPVSSAKAVKKEGKQDMMLAELMKKLGNRKTVGH
jgi:hypothetical protein